MSLLTQVDTVTWIFQLEKSRSGSKVAKCTIQQAFAIAFAFSGCFKDAFSQSRLEHCSLPLTREAAPSFIQNFPQGADGRWIKIDRLFENHDAPFMTVSGNHLLTRPRWRQSDNRMTSAHIRLTIG